jgi:hypothetical protein
VLIKQLKRSIKANRTHESRSIRLAQREKEQETNTAEARAARLAAREQRLARLERDRLEARRLRKYCRGLLHCEASCATNGAKWRDKCAWAETCCACAECALNSTANFGNSRVAGARLRRAAAAEHSRPRRGVENATSGAATDGESPAARGRARRARRGGLGRGRGHILDGDEHADRPRGRGRGRQRAVQ